MGLKFWGNFESLPGFGKTIILVSFQAAGKYNRKQWLTNALGEPVVFLEGACGIRWEYHQVRRPPPTSEGELIFVLHKVW